jgi:hypothetical protein
MILTRWDKFWVTVTLVIFFLYTLYWVNNIWDTIYRRLIVSIPPFPSAFWYYPVLPGIGDIIRFAGACLALLSVYLIWGPKPKPFLKVKKYVAVAIFFEVLYFLTLLRQNIISTFFSSTFPFINSFAYLVQNLLVLLLIVLSVKIWLYKESEGSSVLKWAGVAGFAYLLGIWFVNVFKWVSMGSSAGIGFLLSGTTSLGFLNSAITLSLALIFAAAGFVAYLKQKNSKLITRLIALSLIMVGLHFILFILYVAITNSWRFVFLTEFWPIPLLGLGISMLAHPKTVKTTQGANSTNKL